MIKYISIIIVFVLICKIGLAQENFAANVSSSVSDNEKLLITFDINSNDGAKSFNVILMLTYEGNQVKASSVYGDLGSNIKPGKEKAMVWYFKNDFDGDIKNVHVDVFAYKENEPQAIFEIVSKSNNGYAPSEVTFSNSSSYANEYQWDFGDLESGAANHSFKKDPVHTFTKGRHYTVALIARNTQLQLENTYYQSFEIKDYEATVADFQIDGNNQLPPAKVKFNNKSVNADVFSWDFGDPGSKKKNVSDKKDDEHKYSAPGTYRVLLTVKNNFSHLTDTISKMVTVESVQIPVAKFISNKASEVAPSTVAFKNMSEFSETYKWDFGDPASGNLNASNETDPAHTYTNPGEYLVKLSSYSKSEKKPSVFSETISIKALPKPPEAKFNIENNNILGPATIIFKNISINATSYSWDFGDPGSGTNNTSDKENPTHTYLKGGRYKVTLTATSKNFNTQSAVSDYVIINEPSVPPVAKFTIHNNNGIIPVNVTFTNESTNADVFLWDFGDVKSGHNSSNEMSPMHSYTTAGRYKVVLTATNKSTGGKSIFSDFVVANEAPKALVIAKAKFEISNNNAPSPAVVSFKNLSTDAHSYLWDFGDSKSKENSSVLKDPTHLYSTAGRFMVVLTAKNETSGELSKFTDFVVVTEPAKPVIRPISKFIVTKSVTKGTSEMTFTSTSSDVDSYEWNFGDPDSENNTSVEANPTHIFSKPGRFKVELIVKNAASGLTNSFSDFVTVEAPAVLPVANFEINNNNSVEPATVYFTNTSENANSYAWDFGDPTSGNLNSSTVLSPQHVYKTAGKYKVVLAVLNNSSGKEAIIEKTVVVTQPLFPPKANFDLTFSGEFVPINVQFKNLSTNADKYNWNFGDFDSENNTSDLETPSHFYNQPGNYRITLDVTNTKTDKTDKFSKEITLKSDFITFVKTSEIGENYEQAISVLQISDKEFLTVVNGLGKGSSIIKFDGSGKLINDKKMDALIFEIFRNERNNNNILLGTETEENLFLQNINDNLITEDANPFLETNKYKTDFPFPQISQSLSGELGIIANVFNTKYPIDISFLKADETNQEIQLVDRTFKYIGTKVANDIAPTVDDGFCVTGYWQEDKKSLWNILFGKIDRKGHGEIHLINSEVNILGFCIDESYQNGFAILRAKENETNGNFYELSFTLIDKDGGPTDCANSLPCTIKKDDLLKYKPAMVKVTDGYVIVCHAFNGTNYNIKLFWVDKTGNILIRQDEIKLPNDQFVMDCIQTKDGGFMIAGLEKQGRTSKALIIKTDKFGKVY